MVIKRVALFLTTLLLTNTALADSHPNDEKTTNFIVTPSIAYRYDVFKWAIPDNIFPEYKLSELVWKNRIIQPVIKINLEPQAYQFTISGEVKYGHILKNQSNSWDYDFAVERDKKTGNITSKPYSISKSLATGNILDLSTAIGYSLGLFKNNLVTFYVGYDYSDYRYKNYGDHQLVFKQKLNYYSSGGLFQKYNYRTYSPWLGLSVNTQLNDRLSITPTIKFYSLEHKGQAYCIHRYDFKQNPSFINKAKGKGLSIDLDFIYKYSNNIDLSLNLTTKKFKMKTKKGKSITFYNSHPYYGNNHEPQDLLSLSLRSFSISVGLKYKL